MQPKPDRIRVAILGIGNEQNGDDAAGVLALRAIQRSLSRRCDIPPVFPHARWNAFDLYLIEAGVAPESFTGPLRRFAPHWILYIDAAEMGLPPGAVQVVDWADAAGWSGSTHTLPPTVLAEFLQKTLDCRMTFIGIQPARLDFDSGLSAPVRKAVRTVVRRLFGLLSAAAGSPAENVSQL